MSTLASTSRYNLAVEEGPSTEVVGMCAPLTYEDPKPDIAGYEVYEPLGRGGMGIVYRARQIRLNRIVALKTLRSDCDADAEELARFRLEAEVVAQIAHPGIVQIFEVGEHRGSPYLALEYAAGGSLAGRLEGKPLPSRLSAWLVAQVARAIEAAHERGIVHRDLKPGNILLAAPSKHSVVETATHFSGQRFSSSSSGGVATGIEAAWTAKVTDFGIAKLLESNVPTTRTHAILGTPAYMSPEQADASRMARPASDIYSIGAILYELMTGRPPFVGTSPIDTLLQAKLTDPLPPSVLVPRLPRDLELVCMKCLHKDPARRYPTAAALAEDLHRWLSGEPVQARAAGRRERLVRWCRRHPVGTTLIASGVLGLAGLSIAVVELKRSDVAKAQALVAKQAAIEHANDEEGKAKREAIRASENLKRARAAVDNALIAVANDSELESRGLKQLKLKLLQPVLPFLEEFARQSNNTSTSEDDRAWALFRLAYVHAATGASDRALGEYQASAGVYAGLAKQFPREPMYRQKLVLALNNRAVLLGEVRRPETALAVLDEAVSLGRTLVAERPTEAPLAGDLASSLTLRGRVLQTLGRTAEAETTLRDAVAVCQPLRLSAASAARASADAWTALAALWSAGGRTAELETAHREALAAQLDALRATPSNAAVREAVARARLNLSNYWVNTGRANTAANDLALARQEYETLIAESPGELVYRLQLALCWKALATVAEQNGDHTANREALTKAAQEGELALPVGSVLRTTEACLEHADTQTKFVRSLVAGGKPSEAFSMCRQVERTLHGLEPSAALARANGKLCEARAEALLRLDRYVEALPDIDIVLAQPAAERSSWVALRALALAKGGQPAAAVKAADELLAASPRRAALYPAALALATAGQKMPVADRPRLMGLAVSALERFEREGGFAAKEARDGLQNDSGFDSLRLRPEFVALVKRVKALPSM